MANVDDPGFFEPEEFDDDFHETPGSPIAFHGIHTHLHTSTLSPTSFVSFTERVEVKDVVGLLRNRLAVVTGRCVYTLDALPLCRVWDTSTRRPCPHLFRFGSRLVPSCRQSVTNRKSQRPTVSHKRPTVGHRDPTLFTCRVSHFVLAFIRSIRWESH